MAANEHRLVPIEELAKQLGVRRRTLDRITVEREIPRLRYPGDRKTYVDEVAVRAHDGSQLRLGGLRALLDAREL